MPIPVQRRRRGPLAVSALAKDVLRRIVREAGELVRRSKVPAHGGGAETVWVASVDRQYGVDERARVARAFVLGGQSRDDVRAVGLEQVHRTEGHEDEAAVVDAVHHGVAVRGGDERERQRRCGRGSDGGRDRSRGGVGQRTGGSAGRGRRRGHGLAGARAREREHERCRVGFSKHHGTHNIAHHHVRANTSCLEVRCADKRGRGKDAGRTSGAAMGAIP